MNQVLEEEIVKGPTDRMRRNSRTDATQPLTIRQTEILQLAAQGLSNKAIAQKLGDVSMLTIKNHIQHILASLGAQNRQHAVWLALQDELITLPGVEVVQRPEEFTELKPIVDPVLWIKAGDLELCPEMILLRCRGVRIPMYRLDFKVLMYLLERPGRVSSRAKIIDAVWGTNIFIEERIVDVHIRRVREALIKCGYKGLLQTIKGEGYMITHIPTKSI